jgi:hypothetical protein
VVSILVVSACLLPFPWLRTSNPRPPEPVACPYGRKFMRRRRCWKRGPERGDYFRFAYSALASFRMGMSGSASFQSVRKS